MKPKKKPASRGHLDILPKPRAKKAKRTGKAAKARTVKRGTIDGKYGDGEEAAEDLARRIMNLIDDWGYDQEGRREALDRIKAELLAATTVTETTAEAIGAGWVLPSHGGKPRVFEKGRVAERISVYASQPDEPGCIYVRLVRAQPPKPKRSTK